MAFINQFGSLCEGALFATVITLGNLQDNKVALLGALFLGLSIAQAATQDINLTIAGTTLVAGGAICALANRVLFAPPAPVPAPVVRPFDYPYQGEH